MAPFAASLPDPAQPGADGTRQHELVSFPLGIYSDVDRGWIVDPWSQAQETLNVVVATPVNLWLIWAIVRRTPGRYPLQLALGVSMVYSVVLYHAAGYLSGYAGMREKTLASFATYYALSLPWLLCHAYLAYDGAVALRGRLIEAR